MQRPKSGAFYERSNVYTRSSLFWDVTQRKFVVELPTFRDNLSVPSSRLKESRDRYVASKRIYSRIIFTNSPSFCMTTFSANFTNLTALLPQSHDYSCYVSRPILTPPPRWLQKHTDLRAHDLAPYPDLWHHPSLTNLTCAWSWRLCGITPPVTNYQTSLRNIPEEPRSHLYSGESLKSRTSLRIWVTASSGRPHQIPVC
jgi:hypothetical protein